MTKTEAIEYGLRWKDAICDRGDTELSDAIQFLNIAIEALEQEPKRGKLIAIDDTHDQCMECGAIFCITSSDEWEVNYCPHCGARMESDEE